LLAHSVVDQAFDLDWRLDTIVVAFGFNEKLTDARRLHLLGWQHNLDLGASHFQKIFPDN
jgi:hypothetical protein